MKRELSSVPSVLITQAMEDLELAEKNPKYEIAMGQWHHPKHFGQHATAKDNPCQVCLAGAVMAFSLEMSIDENIVPGQFAFETQGKLRALDAFRMGMIHEGLREMCIETDKDRHVGLFNRRTEHYDTDPMQFKKDMYRIAEDLAKAGL